MTPELKEMIDKLNRGFEAMKSDNDARLKEIEKRGSADVVLVEKVDRMAEAITAMNDLQKRLDKAEKLLARPLDGGTQARDEAVAAARDAVAHYLRTGDGAKMKELIKPSQARALTAGTTTAGGFTVPREIEMEIEKLIIEVSEIDGLITVKNVNTTDYKKNVNKRGLAGTWTDEATTRTTQADSAYAQVSFTNGEFYGYAEVSRWLLEDSQNDIWADMLGDTADVIAQTEGNAVVTGSGTNRPTGMLVGTPVSTADASRAFGVLQYFASGSAAALPTNADVYITASQAMKKGYRKNASWLMNKNTVGTVMKLKDTTGQYLWQPPVVAGAPSMLRGYPVNELEALPDEGANTFPVAFGDFKRGYYMLRIGSMGMVRDEITRPGFVRVYTYRRLGGGLVNSEAIKLIKCAVS